MGGGSVGGLAHPSQQVHGDPGGGDFVVGVGVSELVADLGHDVVVEAFLADAQHPSQSAPGVGLVAAIAVELLLATSSDPVECGQHETRVSPEVRGSCTPSRLDSGGNASAWRHPLREPRAHARCQPDPAQPPPPTVGPAPALRQPARPAAVPHRADPHGQASAQPLRPAPIHPPTDTPRFRTG